MGCLYMCRRTSLPLTVQMWFDWLHNALVVITDLMNIYSRPLYLHSLNSRSLLISDQQQWYRQLRTSKLRPRRKTLQVKSKTDFKKISEKLSIGLTKKLESRANRKFESV